MADPADRPVLGAMLRAEGMVTREMLQEGIAAAGAMGQALGQFLNAEGHVAARELYDLAARDYQVPTLQSLPDEWVDASLARRLPAPLLLKLMLLPFAKLGSITLIAFGTLPDERFVRDVRRRLDGPIKVVLCPAAEIERHLDRLSGASRVESVAAQRITDEEFAALSRAAGTAAIQRWMKLHASGEPLPAAFLGRPKA